MTSNKHRLLAITSLPLFFLVSNCKDKESNSLSLSNINDEVTIDRIVSNAVDSIILERRSINQKKLTFCVTEDEPYTGWAKMFHTNGNLKSLTKFESGLQQGNTFLWYEDNTIKWMLTYQKGQLCGRVIRWDRSGNKTIEAIETGVEGSRKFTTYYSDGTKSEEVNTENYLLHGPYTYWHNNGKVESKGTFHEGILEGRFRTWHENGEKAVESYYKDGKLYGRGKAWNIDGELIQDMHYPIQH